MKRVIVIGCPGSGKSTFARALQTRTGLSLHYLDMLYWNADRTTVARDAFRARLNEILLQEEWIIDGNYSSTMELRMQACDTIFFLDYATEVCLAGILSRRGKARPDHPRSPKESGGSHFHLRDCCKVRREHRGGKTPDLRDRTDI